MAGTHSGRSRIRIGVISDTHNYLEPGVARHFAGVDHILHGGDIGNPQILRELERVAPVTAVTGNTDDPGFQYPLFASVLLGGKKFLLHHIVNPASLSLTLERRIERDKPDVVVFGHTHKPLSQMSGGVLFFNPGYAGKPRFGMPRSIGILDVADQIKVEVLGLE